MPPDLIRIAETWLSLPSHIREAIQTLVDAASPNDQEHPSYHRASKRNADLTDEAAWRMAQECRSVVQSCLREEEWKDADQEFFAVISKGLQGCNL